MKCVMSLCVAAGLLGLAFALSTAPAHADGGYLRCAVGDRVQNRDNKVGTVKALGFGGDATTCMVQWDGERDVHMSLFWMLRPAGKPITNPAEVAVIKPGRYACYSGVPPVYADNGILIRSAGTYEDFHGHAGAYSYDPRTQLITFKTGTFASSHGQYRHAGEISLSLTPINSRTYFNTVCDLHQ